jgi:hypothetical protein
MAMSGKSDSAFQYLNILWNKTEYIDKDSLLNEKLLSPLWSDSRWDKLIFQTTPKMPEIAQKLSEIRIKDQESRQKLNAAQAKFGKDSKEYRSHLSKLNAEDSVNQLYVVDLLDKHGWLGRQDIGNSGCTALFNVFLHASIEVQEKYLPVMKAAVKEGKARKQNHAYLEDRVLVRRNKKQLYGSQLKAGGSVYYPILDVKNLNERRSYVGLAAFDDVEMAEIMRQSQSWK